MTRRRGPPETGQHPPANPLLPNLLGRMAIVFYARARPRVNVSPFFPMDDVGNVGTPAGWGSLETGGTSWKPDYPCTSAEVPAVSAPGQSNGFASGSVQKRAPTASAAATVIMFHANEARAKDAFVAEDVLRQYSG